jgi:hypothetical protein
MSNRTMLKAVLRDPNPPEPRDRPIQAFFLVEDTPTPTPTPAGIPETPGTPDTEAAINHWALAHLAKSSDGAVVEVMAYRETLLRTIYKPPPLSRPIISVPVTIPIPGAIAPGPGPETKPVALGRLDKYGNLILATPNNSCPGCMAKTRHLEMTEEEFRFYHPQAGVGVDNRKAGQ